MKAQSILVTYFIHKNERKLYALLSILSLMLAALHDVVLIFPLMLLCRCLDVYIKSERYKISDKVHMGGATTDERWAYRV